MFPHRFGFGFGEFDGCGPFGFPRHRFFFNDGIDCFGGGFFFDPFFIDAFSESFIGGPGFWEGRIGNGADDSTAAPGAGENLGPQSSAAILTESGSDTGNGAADNAQPGSKAKSEPTVSLLQLRDGSMYGLTQYWVEGSQLHYVTTYGGQDSIALDRIDLEATMKLNSERGVEFVLKPKTNPQ